MTAQAVSSSSLEHLTAEQRARFEPVLQQCAASLKTEFGSDLHALLLCGSVAFGRPRRRSDIDLLAIVGPPAEGAERRVLVIEGECVDLVVYSASEVRRSLLAQDDPGLITKIGRAIILTSSESAADLIALGRSIFAHGRRQMDPTQASFMLNALRDLWQSALDVEQTNTWSLNHCINVATLILLDLERCLKRLWVSTKPAYQLDDLDTYAPEIAVEMRAMSSPALAIPIRLGILQRMIARAHNEVCREIPEFQVK